MDSIFPYINPETVALASTEKDLPMFKEYAYDFKNNCLLYRQGNTYLVEGNEALKVWIFKALHTDRYRHIAYTKAYGTEVRTLMGKPIQGDVLTAELQRLVVETLMVNPYIKELKNFAFEVVGAGVTVFFECITVYGEMQEMSYQYMKGG